MAGGGGSSGGFESYLPIAAALAATVMTDGAAAPLLEESLGATGAAAVTGAGIGAVTGGGVAALTGQNVAQNALMGGIGGAGIGASGLYQGAEGVAAAGGNFGAAASTLGTTPETLASGYAGMTPVDIASSINAAPAGTTPGLFSTLGNGITGTQAMYGVGGVGLLGAMTADKAKYGVPANSAVNWNGGSLSNFRYDPRSYNPDNVSPPNPAYQAQYKQRQQQQDQTQTTPYQPVYAAGGGLMQDQTNFANGGMYPMSQQDHTQFATSPQMPASMQATMASYDPETNPLTGEPTAHMASGGDVGKFDTPLADPTGYKLQPSMIYTQVPQDPNSLLPQDILNIMQANGFAGGNGGFDFPHFNGPTSSSAQGHAAGGMMSGGIADLGSYSDGGQLLKGPGDGMSDSIPAKIGKSQPARLADSEFVVPADVVSHLGNGSSDAGAKKLYAMMNNVRKARTGKKKQAPQINAAKYLPA